MRKILLILMVFITLFSSCEKEVNTSFRLVKVLINKTDKDLIYFVNTNVSKDSKRSFGNDSISLIFVKNSKTNLPPIGPYYIDVENVAVEKEVVFNLSDTSFFEFNQNRLSWSEKDSLYWANMSLEAKGTTFNTEHTETLQYSDELLDIMCKDYSMLEKFPEYYSKK